MLQAPKVFIPPPFRSKTLSTLITLSLTFSLLTPTDVRAGATFDKAISVFCGSTMGLVTAGALQISLMPGPLPMICGTLAGITVIAGAYAFQQINSWESPLGDEENPMLPGEQTPDSAQTFTQRHELHLILEQGNVKVYSQYPKFFWWVGLKKVKALAADLQKSFSIEGECPLCMEDWKELGTTSTQEQILSWNNCDCPYLYCVNCSDRVTNQPCPHCRKPEYKRDLIFVINGTETATDPIDAMERSE